MRKLKIIIPALFLIFSINGIASHVAGVELNATHITGDNYLVTLSFYRDCSGVAVDATSTIYFNSSCGSFTVTLNQVSGTGTEIPIYCNSAYPTTCNGGLLFGVQKYEYQGIVSLPPCSSYKFYYTMCCRNPSNTIVNPTSADIYVEAKLDNLNAPYNSLPHFNTNPALIVCSGQQNFINNDVTDPDGDSISYKLVTPFDDGPVGSVPYVTYVSGYSEQYPIQSDHPIKLDSLTGLLTLDPSMNISGVYAVQIDEYRRINGTMLKIGSIMRDMQIYSIVCTNPRLAGINPNATEYNVLDVTYSLKTVSDTDVYFNIYPHLHDTTQNLILTWDEGIPGASFSVTNNNTPSAIGHFYWHTYWPVGSYYPACFNATVTIPRCSKTFQYCLTIDKPVGVDNSNFDEDIVKVIPCPAKDNITIEFNDDISKNYYVVIINYLGQKIFSGEYYSATNRHLNIAVSNFKNGVYFIQLTTDKKIYRKKFVISH